MKIGFSNVAAKDQRNTYWSPSCQNDVSGIIRQKVQIIMDAENLENLKIGLSYLYHIFHLMVFKMLNPFTKQHVQENHGAKLKRNPKPYITAVGIISVYSNLITVISFNKRLNIGFWFSQILKNSNF